MKKDNSEKDSTTPVAETAEPVATIEAATLTPGQLDELKKTAAKADEFKDNWLRTAADLENYRKRAARERAEAIQYANVGLIQKLLPVLDNFEMAIAASQNVKEQNAASLQAGITMIQSQLKSALAETGLEEIEATGKAFDATLHEAISQQETADVPEGNVVQQIRKGYRLKERLLRPATVIVAKQPAK